MVTIKLDKNRVMSNLLFKSFNVRDDERGLIKQNAIKSWSLKFNTNINVK